MSSPSLAEFVAEAREHLASVCDHLLNLERGAPEQRPEQRDDGPGEGVSDPRIEERLVDLARPVGPDDREAERAPVGGGEEHDDEHHRRGKSS